MKFAHVWKAFWLKIILYTRVIMEVQVFKSSQQLLRGRRILPASHPFGAVRPADYSFNSI